MSNKATFRALRDEVGLSQADFAALMGVHLNSVKRWENPNFSQQPPADAFATLDDLLNERDFLVRKTLHNGALDFEHAQAITLTYYRDQAEFELFGRDEGNFKIANANARAVARALKERGLTVDFCYPQDKENIYQQAKRKL